MSGRRTHEFLPVVTCRPSGRGDRCVALCDFYRRDWHRQAPVLQMPGVQSRMGTTGLTAASAAICPFYARPDPRLSIVMDCGQIDFRFSRIRTRIGKFWEVDGFPRPFGVFRSLSSIPRRRMSGQKLWPSGRGPPVLAHKCPEPRKPRPSGFYPAVLQTDSAYPLVQVLLSYRGTVMT